MELWKAMDAQSEGVLYISIRRFALLLWGADPYYSKKSDPDTHESEKMDLGAEPHKSDADPEPLL